MSPETRISSLISLHLFISHLWSLLSDSNQRPRDYKSRALQPTTFATFPSWRIRRELTVQDLPVLFTFAGAKVMLFLFMAKCRNPNS